MRALFDWLAAAVGDMTIAAEAGDRSMVLPMVLKGIGAGLMPDGWSELATRAGADVYRFDPPERLPQWLVHRSGPVTAATGAFIDTTLEVRDQPASRRSRSSSVSRRTGTRAAPSATATRGGRPTRA